MNAKHRRTLAAVFVRPTSATIKFSDLETLFKSLGATVGECAGSRVRVELGAEQWRCH
jgi:hypothetical protein